MSGTVVVVASPESVVLDVSGTVVSGAVVSEPAVSELSGDVVDVVPWFPTVVGVLQSGLISPHDSHSGSCAGSQGPAG